MVAFIFITARSFKAPALNWWTAGNPNCTSPFFIEVEVLMYVSLDLRSLDLAFYCSLREPL
jgi:hypothetical protein